MSDLVRVDYRDGVSIIRISNPPVNALSTAVRAGLVDALKVVKADHRTRSVVIACSGRTFVAGADISEFDLPPVEPTLPYLVNLIEASPKPVVAAIHGTALGGGCEIAIACHYRIAAQSARLGLPEVKLGLVPGSGGTQRLPRLVGISRALEIAAKGEPVTAAMAFAAGLVDRVVRDESLMEDAVAFAQEIFDAPIPRTGQRTVEPDPEAVADFLKRNARRFKGYEAPIAAVDCVAHAAEVPLAEGMRYERERFLSLKDGIQSAAQRHLFFSERLAAKLDGLPDDVATRPIHHVGIVGAGTMGGGIAMNFLSAGLRVTIVETQADLLDRGVAAIRRNYEAGAGSGRLSSEQAQMAVQALTPSLDLEDLAGCDLIIEAVYENMEVKKSVFRRLGEIARPDAILASNTSYLDLDEIALTVDRPENVVGLHFFSPANIMKLLEIVRGARTAPDVMATALALAKQIGKIPVVAGVTPGFIGNRILRKRQDAAMQLLLEGATPEQIDRVHVDFGLPMGPFQMTDLAGVDIGWHRDPLRIEGIRDALNAEGRLGQKVGAGFYDYDASRNRTSSARVAAIIEEWRRKSGCEQRAITDDEIVERTLYPMVNEGALILAEGKAQRASDIDVVWVHGYGWPRYRGGPMFWGEREGFGKIAQALLRHGIEPAPSMADYAG